MSTEKVVGGVSGALGGAAAGAALGSKIGALAGPVGIIGGALIGGLAGIFGSKKPKYKPIDVAKLAEDARKNAETNLIKGLELERKYLPTQAAFRSSAENALLQRLDRVGQTDYLDQLMRGAAGATQFLPEGSVGRQILEDAKLGGALTADVQAEVTKAALEGAGQAGLSGSMAGRGRVARDIGISSQLLRQQRLAQALGIEQTMANQYLASEQAAANEVGRLGLASLALPLPEAGLSAGDLASVAVGGQNAANAAAANSAASRNAQLAQLFGAATSFAGAMGGMGQAPGSTVPGVGLIESTPFTPGAPTRLAPTPGGIAVLPGSIWRGGG